MVGAAAQGVADGRTAHVVIWLVVAAAITLGTSLLEIVKSRSVPSVVFMWLFEGPPEVVLARWTTFGVFGATLLLGAYALLFM